MLQPWGLGLTLNVASQLTSMAVPYIYGATKIDVVIDDNLIALSQASSGAFIAKKDFKVSTVNTLGDDNVLWFSPELGIFIKQMNRRTDKHPQGAGTQNIELLSYKRGD